MAVSFTLDTTNVAADSGFEDDDDDDDEEWTAGSMGSPGNPDFGTGGDRVGLVFLAYDAPDTTGGDATLDIDTITVGGTTATLAANVNGNDDVDSSADPWSQLHTLTDGGGLGDNNLAVVVNYTYLNPPDDNRTVYRIGYAGYATGVDESSLSNTVTAKDNTATSDSPSATITTVSDNSLIVGIVHARDGGNGFTPDGNTTELDETSSGGSGVADGIAAIVERSTTTAGNYTLGGTLDSADEWSMILIELPEKAAAAGADIEVIGHYYRTLLQGSGV